MIEVRPLEKDEWFPIQTILENTRVFGGRGAVSDTYRKGIIDMMRFFYHLPESLAIGIFDSEIGFVGYTLFLEWPSNLAEPLDVWGNRSVSLVSCFVDISYLDAKEGIRKAIELVMRDVWPSRDTIWAVEIPNGISKNKALAEYCNGWSKETIVQVQPGDSIPGSDGSYLCWYGPYNTVTRVVRYQRGSSSNAASNT